MDNIYIFETRQLNYLDAYVAKAKTLHYNPIIITDDALKGDARLAEFKKYYQHLSPNPYNFEFNCFARYFALANVLTDDDPFIASDSDIFITNRKLSLTDPALRSTFVGSDAFYTGASDWQISPHFSFWDRELVNNFVDYLVAAYKRNQDDQFLVKHYEVQKSRLGYTAISDMTLLYLWVNDNKIPFINSNSITNNWGIDHNISVLNTIEARYRSEHNRKKVEFAPSGDAYCILESGERQHMSCLHFQGPYKPILADLYAGNYRKFDEFSANTNFTQKVHYLAGTDKHKKYRKLAGEYSAIELALDTYRHLLDIIPDDLFDVTPPNGGWSYTEVYSHIMQATLGSTIAAERCTQSNCKPTTKGANWLGKAVLFFGIFPPVSIKEPKVISEKMKAVKITKEEARNLIIKCRKRIDTIASLMQNPENNGRVAHPRLGMLNAKQWFKFIGIHLRHHLKQLKRIDKMLGR